MKDYLVAAVNKSMHSKQFYHILNMISTSIMLLVSWKQSRPFHAVLSTVLKSLESLPDLLFLYACLGVLEFKWANASKRIRSGGQMYLFIF